MWKEVEKIDLQLMSDFIPKDSMGKLNIIFKNHLHVRFVQQAPCWPTLNLVFFERTDDIIVASLG